MKASENQFPSVTLQEVATDGSDLTNPAADHQRLFLGEDGGLHLRDSAGTVTDVLAASGAPTDAPYVTTAADGSLSAEVVRPQLGNFYAETYPPSPNATYDDEFDDTTGMSGTVNGLNARWNWRNQGAATVSFTKAGWLTLNVPAKSGGNDFRILEIAGFADGTYEAKMSLEGPLNTGSATGFHGGIALIDNANGDFYLVGTGTDNTTKTLPVIQRWTNVTTFNSSVYGDNGPGGRTSMYLRVTKSSTTLTAWFSDDGIGWQRAATWSDAVSADRIGICANENNQNLGLVKLHVDYFRKTA